MIARRDLKKIHEAAVLHCFNAHLKNRGTHLNILDRPEPPDAIVEVGGERTWIEITDAFIDRKHAIGITSGACNDVEHIRDDGRRIDEPNKTFSKVLHTVIEAKYDRPSIRAVADTEGPGILLVGVFTPFTSSADVVQNEAASISDLISTKAKPLFTTIYVYDGYGKREFHVLYSR